jgi:drug/metabolite transporter (DMT)-like permease
MGSSNTKLYIATLIAMAVWGLSWTNAKILGYYGDAQLMMFWRFTIATLSFAPIVYYTKNSFSLNIKSFRFIALNAIFMTSYNYFYFKGTQVGLAGAGGVLVTTLNPINTAILAAILYKIRLYKKDIYGMILGFIGGGLIIEIWRMNLSLLFQSGNIHFLMASLSWAIVTLITSRSKDILPFIPYSFWSFCIASLMSLFFAMDQPLLSVFHFDWIFWLNMMLLAIGSMAFGTTVYFLASVRLGPQKASAFIFTVPVTAMLFAIILLDEKLTYSITIGSLLALFAVYLINKRPK